MTSHAPGDEEELAAAQLRQALDQKLGQPAKVILRLAHGWGVAVVNPDARHDDENVNIVFVLPAGSQVPATAHETFLTASDGQQSLAIEIWRQNSTIPSPLPADNLYIGSVTLSGLPSLPKGSPLDATFSVTADGVLTVRMDARTGTTIERTFEPWRVDLPSTGDLFHYSHDADRLAALLVSPETIPPLSVAVLGEWGSGKSTFMRFVEDRISGLVSGAEETLDQDEGTIANIRQIRINAWLQSEDTSPSTLIEQAFRKLAPHNTPAGRRLTGRLARANIRTFGRLPALGVLGFIVAVVAVLATLGVIGLLMGAGWQMLILGLGGAVLGLSASLLTYIAIKRHRAVAAITRRDDNVTPSWSPTNGRIIIYIDDLDRCLPGQVAEVLQAMQRLLLAGPFVIVVAVDPRWLVESLGPYQNLFGDGKPESLGLFNRLFDISLAIRPASPGRLRSFLASIPITPAPASSELRPVTDPSSPRSTPPSPSVGLLPVVTVSETDQKFGEGVLRSSKLRNFERQFLIGVAPLVHTPRTVKRLVNLYRLARLGVPSEQLEDYLGGPEGGPYQAVALLLAAVVGEPREANLLLEELTKTAREGDILEVLAIIDGPLAAKLSRLIVTLREGGPVHGDVTTYQRWAKEVAQYSIETYPLFYAAVRTED